jgi:hypothetical protein
VVVGHEAQAPLAHRRRRVRAHLAARHVPLRLDERLDDVAGARADAEAHLVVRLAAVEPELCEPLDDGLACVEAHHASELAARVGHAPLLREDRDEG